MPKQVTTNEFLQLREQFPVVDVRSPKEFTEGHITDAINIPILNDAERHAVGIDYKSKGQAEAVKTGLRLVGPRLADLVEAASAVAREKTLLVHCWRGGMRSGNFSWLMEVAGISCINLKGGYKAYRQAAIDAFEQTYPFMIITGTTGSGKTDIIKALAESGEQVVDLEAIANHKGSVFGGMGLGDQPSTEQFQNNLFEALFKLDRNRRIWIEDESIAIGKVFLPDSFWKHLRKCPLVQIEVEKANRVKQLVKDYGKADTQKLLEAIDKITKKLGGQHAKAAKESLLAGDLSTTADILLTYYDKAYQNGLASRQAQVVMHSDYDGMHADAFARQLIQKIQVTI